METVSGTLAQGVIRALQNYASIKSAGGNIYLPYLIGKIFEDGEVGVESGTLNIPRDLSVMLNFSKEPLTLGNNTGWNLRSVSSMGDATAYLQSLKSGGRKIGNLVLIGHGNYEHITLGETG